MEIQQLDAELDELESRLDRLRGLYEQYFLGIEKIEPSVARKDVDRRFWILRRVKIRNTARRFRMQVLIQRYNTFQQYWARICREIENGTYVRHLLRVQKKAGGEPMTWAAKKRLGLLRRDRAAVGAGGDGAADAGAADGNEPLDGRADLAAEAARAAALAAANANQRPSTHPASAPAPRTPTAAAAARGAFTLEDLGPLDLDFDEESAPPPPRAAAPAPKPAAAEAPKKPAASPVAPMNVAPNRAPGSPMPLPKAAPAFPAAGRPNPAPTGNGAAGLSDDRVRTLHAELVAAKRNLNQGDAVSVDSLARTLRETEKKLRAQHQGKAVDFQIVVKDGKPIVKPIVRK